MHKIFMKFSNKIPWQNTILDKEQGFWTQVHKNSIINMKINIEKHFTIGTMFFCFQPITSILFNHKIIEKMLTHNS
jgi:hypothetical protein